MVLEPSKKSCPPNSLVVIIGDSTTTKAAFTEGRSSETLMMARCRRQATLQLAAGLTPVLLHVRSALNPAYDGTKHRYDCAHGVRILRTCNKTTQ